VSINAGATTPTPAYVGDVVSGTVTAAISPASLDGDGSGLTYVTYSWDCDQIWESDDDGVNDPWTLYADGDGLSGQYSEDLVDWIDDCGPTRFWHEFDDPGYYVLHVIVNAEIHDSRTGAVIETVTNDAYVGDGGGSSDASNARQAAGRAAGGAAQARPGQRKMTVGRPNPNDRFILTSGRHRGGEIMRFPTPNFSL